MKTTHLEKHLFFDPLSHKLHNLFDLKGQPRKIEGLPITLNSSPLTLTFLTYERHPKTRMWSYVGFCLNKILNGVFTSWVLNEAR